MQDWAQADLVHASLAWWARQRPQALALSNGQRTLGYAELYQAVEQRAQCLIQAPAPATMLVDANAATLDRLVEFLAIVASGRCAAMAEPDWPPAVRAAVLASLSPAPALLPTPHAQTPFYIGYTSGSTGLPKGFRRHHRSWTESFRVCVQELGPHAAGRILAPGKLSHSLFLFAALLGLWSGAGAVLQERFSAAATLRTLGQGETPCLVAVPSQLLLMLALAARRRLAPMAGVRLILISGARWMRHRTGALQALFPQARIVEFYGASETSFITWMDALEDAPPDAVGRPFGNVELDIRERPVPDAPGLIYVRSPMLFMDYVGGAADATAALRDGDWLSVKDMGYLDEAGRLCLVGRQNRMLVTQGKNLFPDEVEAVLSAHPAIAQVSVQGLPDALRGSLVVACVQFAPDPDQARPSAAQLVAWCSQRLEPYKVPRQFFTLSGEPWPHTFSGKTDHGALAQRLRPHPPLEPAWPCPPLSRLS